MNANKFKPINFSITYSKILVISRLYWPVNITSLSVCISLSLYIYIYIHTHTHTKLEFCQFLIHG
jgi:hypothetical protein